MLSSGRQLLIRDSAQRQHATHVSDLFDPTTCRDGRMKVDFWIYFVNVFVQDVTAALHSLCVCWFVLNVNECRIIQR